MDHPPSLQVHQMFEVPRYERIHTGGRGNRDVAQVVSIPSRYHFRCFIGGEKPSAFESLCDQLELHSSNPIQDLASKIYRGAVELLLHDVRNHADVRSCGKPSQETAGKTETALVVSIGQCPENGGVEVEAHAPALPRSERKRQLTPFRVREMRVEPCRAKPLGLAEEAIAVNQRRGTGFYELRAQLTRMRARREIDGIEATREIEAVLERVLARVREAGARGFEPQVYLERAELARLTGDAVGRQRELREAHRLFSEMGATSRATEIARELDL
jgi:hypothetical protein